MFKDVKFDQHDVIGTLVALLLFGVLGLKWIDGTILVAGLTADFAFILGSNTSLLSGKTNGTNPVNPAP